MLTSHRKRLILDKLRAEGQVIAKSISHELGLSEDTIRRDLRELAQEGLLQRVHGERYRLRRPLRILPAGSFLEPTERVRLAELLPK
jgi:DeoR/GlpR family transcriptional regulator of sugar metabolism